MIDAIVRISGSIFIAGIGMVGLFLGTDCVYYAEYGQLDDMTMSEVEK
jgi:hypothetical protein|tara:strand:+ start:50 stop:193 length:144 start_codon:yes stop_codon:yes gene_type:complete